MLLTECTQFTCRTPCLWSPSPETVEILRWMLLCSCWVWVFVLCALSFKPPHKSNKVLSQRKVEVKHRGHRKPLRSASELENATSTVGDIGIGVMNRRVCCWLWISQSTIQYCNNLPGVRYALQKRVSRMVLMKRVSFGAMREVFDGRVISCVLWSVRYSDLTL